MNDVGDRLSRALRSLGLDVRRWRPLKSDIHCLAMLLQAQHCSYAIDVGANVGQFGSSLRDAGYRGRIVSFEPLPDAYLELQKRASRDPDWHVAERVALGAHEGLSDMHVAGNSVSSSLVPMTSIHETAAAASAYTGTERVRVTRLDEYLRGDEEIPGRGLFLKIDTQGYEAQVIEGAGELLSACDVVRIEASLVELYSGQRLLPYFLGFFADAGFDLWSVDRGFVDPASGRTLQADLTFCRVRS